ncbi:MAG: HAMP domain-containing histidine kinase, partial [Vallitaleaceae bacterium]|nr:HAMP domain-containing histidine kinase [Vallitaleaceae bacterium]
VVLSVTLSLLYSDLLFQQEQERLADIAIKTESLYTNRQEGLIGETKLQHYMDAMGYVSKSKIYILNINNNSLENLKNLEFNNNDLDSYLYQDLKDILSGNEVFRNSQYTETFDTMMVFYGRPIIVNNAVQGAIIIFSPIQTVNQNIRAVLFIILVVAVFSSLIVGLLLLFNAKRITKPIKIVRDSTLKIANGDTIEDIGQTKYIELNELTSAFNYMKNELLRIEEDKRTFISMISHEIKTPLTVISGYLEAIHDGVLIDKEIDESLEIIYRETERLTKLTKEIVTQTSNRDLRIYLEPTIFKLRPILDESAHLARMNGKKEIQFVIACDDDITLYADENKIRQVLSNLISNSIKYSDVAVTIELKCTMVEDRLCLEVIDNGWGIKKSDLSKVFDTYYRVKNIADPQEGSGLGLNIVKRLIELHNGTIEIKSEIKKGTTVTMWFPL